MKKYTGTALTCANIYLTLFFTVLSLIVQPVKTYADDYIVVYKSHSHKQNMLKHPTFPVARDFNIIPAVAASLDANQLEELQSNPDIEYIEPDYKIYALGGPDGSYGYDGAWVMEDRFKGYVEAIGYKVVLKVYVKVDTELKTRLKETLAECRAWGKEFAKSLK